MDWLDGSRARPRSRYYRRAGALGGFGTASNRSAHGAARRQREVRPLPEHPRLCDRRGGARRSRQRPLGHPGEVQAGLTERSEEHTSELQSLAYLVCRLLLEKKKKV